MDTDSASAHVATVYGIIRQYNKVTLAKGTYLLQVHESKVQKVIMINHRNILSIVITVGLGLAFLLPTVGCASQITQSLYPSATATVKVDTTTDFIATPPPPPPQSTTEATASTDATPDSQAVINLTLWTDETASPRADGDAGRVFENGLGVFEATYPGVAVSVTLKNPTGKGSALDYLRTASQVAPSILPDIVILNTIDLAQAARAGLVVPLDDLVSSNLLNDLLPAARAAGTVDERLVGIPFEMDVEHLVYNTNKVSTTPVKWANILNANTTYAFPAKGLNGLANDAFLIQYLALGGQLQNEAGQPSLDEQVLRTVLSYYHQGIEEGVISPSVLEFGTTDDIWPTYVAAQLGMAHVNSHRFLTDRSVLHSTEFTSIPNRDGKPLTISRGKALAIVTRDPIRQAMAIRLIEWIMAPDINATWNQTAAHIPTRYTAFDLIEGSDPYWSFLRQQLEIAVPPPAFAGYDQIGRVLQQAIAEVLSNEASPEEAAAAAMDVIIP